MTLNDKELNKVITESIKKYLIEAPNRNGNTNPNEFNQTYIDNTNKYKPASMGAQIGKTAAKGAATYAGAQIGAGMFSSMMDMSYGAGQGLAGVLAGVGLGLLATKLVGSMVALKRFKQLKFPRIPGTAMQYAKYAAAERTQSQEICRNLQINLKNAIAAFNKAFQTRQDLDSMTKDVGQAQFYDRGQIKNVDTNFNRDFNNLNTGQNEASSKNGTMINEGPEERYTRAIINAQDFFNEFNNFPGDKTAKKQEALKVIGIIKLAYRNEYGIWMQWTRYINVLVHKFSRFGMTWEMVINSNQSSKPQSIINAFLKKQFGIEQTNDINDYQPSQAAKELTIRVAKTRFPIGKKIYTLFQDINSPMYFALEYKKGLTSINRVRFTQGTPFKFNYSQNLTQNTANSQNGYKIIVLFDGAIKKMHPITDSNGQVQKL